MNHLIPTTQPQRRPTMKKVTFSFNVPTFKVPSIDVSKLKDAASEVMVDTTNAARSSVAKQLNNLATFIEPSQEK